MQPAAEPLDPHPVLAWFSQGLGDKYLYQLDDNPLKPADIAPGIVEVLVAKSATATARQRMQASIQALRVEPYKQALHAIITTDFRVVLPHIGVPTLVIVGDEDVVTPPADSEFLTRNIPGAKLVTIPGAGHLTNIEQPEAFNAALEAFLNPYASDASVVSAGRV
jgi:3-oxoadipate enol-lactonase